MLLDPLAKRPTPPSSIKIPPGYRDWKLISVAHEAGVPSDIRALLGNEIAIKAYRENRLPFPDGAIIARLAWSYVPSEENDKVFGRDQSFVAGAATNVQFMIKDSEKVRRDRRLGIRLHFTGGKPVNEAAAGAALFMPRTSQSSRLSSSPSTRPDLKIDLKFDLKISHPTV